MGSLDRSSAVSALSAAVRRRGGRGTDRGTGCCAVIDAVIGAVIGADFRGLL
jgi:hypothetical protein